MRQELSTGKDATTVCWWLETASGWFFPQGVFRVEKGVTLSKAGRGAQYQQGEPIAKRREPSLEGEVSVRWSMSQNVKKLGGNQG